MTEAEDMEYSECEDRIVDIRHLLSIIEDDMAEDETGSNKQSSLGRVYDLLWKCEFILMGRLNELEPDNSARWGKTYGISQMYRKEAELARESGVNFVAIWEHVHGEDNKIRAIKYIKENGLASLNYEATCDAIEQYESDRRHRRTA